jgi:osmotically-inducible protein OsmY
MAISKKTPDKNLLQSVNQKLARSGSGSQTKITASISNGDVTLTGIIGYEYERRAILRSASGITGVRRVIDQLRVEQKKKCWE